MQIVSGMYPIAQVREPYTAVGYLAERMPLVKLLQLEHPDSLDTLVSKNTARSRTRQPPPSSRDEFRTRSNETSLERDCDELSQATGGSAEEVWTAWNICDGKWCTRSSRAEILHMNLCQALEFATPPTLLHPISAFINSSSCVNT